MTVDVRAERPGDHAAVARVHEAAFGRPEEARLVRVLRAATAPMLSLVAERAGRIAGHVLLTPVAIDGSDGPPSAGLAPLGVLPDEQGRGVGSALVREALRLAPERGWQAVFLLGEPEYYERFGFTLAAPRGLHYESSAFDRGFQVIELVPGALGGRRGRVRYHPAFAGV